MSLKQFALSKVNDAENEVSNCIAKHINNAIGTSSEPPMDLVQAGLSEIESKIEEMFDELKMKIQSKE